MEYLILMRPPNKVKGRKWITTGVPCETRKKANNLVEDVRMPGWEYIVIPVPKSGELDKCKFCLGFKGGVLGNENIIKGVITCDYCHSLLMTMDEYDSSKTDNEPSCEGEPFEKRS
jgi:hypothetical protein